MKVPDVARFLKCKGTRRQSHLLPGTPQDMCLVACGCQEVLGADDTVRFALLALLFHGGWPQGFRQP